MYNSYTLYIVYVHIYMVYCIIISYTTCIMHTHYIVYVHIYMVYCIIISYTTCIINTHYIVYAFTCIVMYYK